MKITLGFMKINVEIYKINYNNMTNYFHNCNDRVYFSVYLILPSKSSFKDKIDVLTSHGFEYVFL